MVKGYGMVAHVIVKVLIQFWELIGVLTFWDLVG